MASPVVPTGYSFNLDGTNIYMTLAALFIAPATNTDLSLQRQVLLLLVAMLLSKGAAGVPRPGFITLAATLSVVPKVPVTGMALILGVDHSMSEWRSNTNLIGNAVVTVAVSRWQGALDREKFDAVIGGRGSKNVAPPSPARPCILPVVNWANTAPTDPNATATGAPRRCGARFCC